MAFWYQTGEPTFTARAPHGRGADAAQPRPDDRLAKDFTAEQHHGPGEAGRAEPGPVPRRPQLLYKPEQPEDAWIEIPFEVKKKEPLRLLLVDDPLRTTSASTRRRSTA